jgi:hypothetical protein
MQQYAPGIIRDQDAYARVGRVGRWTWKVELIIPMMWPGNDLRETPRGILNAVLTEGRARFRGWWHQGERPSRHWRHDVRVSGNGTGERAASGIREQLKQRRCKDKAKRIAAGLQEPTVKVEPLTADQIAAIAKVYRSGATIVQCMDRFRETSWRVRSALATAGVQMRPRGIPKRGTRMKSRG